MTGDGGLIALSVEEARVLLDWQMESSIHPFIVGSVRVEYTEPKDAP